MGKPKTPAGRRTTLTSAQVKKLTGKIKTNKLTFPDNSKDKGKEAIDNLADATKKVDASNSDQLHINNAKAKLGEFFNAWKKSDHNLMASLTNKSWLLDGHPLFNADGWINSHLSFLKPMSWEIGEPVRIGEAMMQFPVKAKIKQGDGTVAPCLMNINMLCETGAYNPSLEGTWGVNPVSVMQMNWNVK